jgi:hypothetical protein
MKINHFFIYFISLLLFLGSNYLIYPTDSYADTAKTVKLISKEIGKKAGKLLKKSRNRIKIGVGRTFGGSSAMLASRLGKVIKKGWAAHHIIPVQLKNHSILKKIGMDMDRVTNGIALPMKPGLHPKLPLHRGSHPNYTAAISKTLDEIPKNLPVNKTKELVDDVIKKFRKKLENGKPLHSKYGGNKWY